MGTCIIEPNIGQFRKHCLSTPNGTIDVEAYAPFHILVENFRRSVVFLPKVMVLAYASPMNKFLIRETNMTLEDVIGIALTRQVRSNEKNERILMADSKKFRELCPPIAIKRKKEDIFDVKDLDFTHLSDDGRCELVNMVK